ncbi:MAG: two-component regulator propeller domain-containing protein [Bacteroidia bacterium]
MKKHLKTYWYCTLATIIFTFFSFCTPQKTKNTEQEFNVKEPVRITEKKTPKTIYLDSCKAPLTFKIPLKGEKSYPINNKSIGTKITVNPPLEFLLNTSNASDIAFHKNYNQDQNITYTIISCGYTDKYGNTWFGTSGGGICQYNGKQVINYTTTQGLAGNLIKCIKEDMNGDIWIGTNGNGVSKYDGKKFINYSTNEGLAGNAVYCIVEDKNNDLWIGTDKGLSRCSINSKTNDIKKEITFTNFYTKDGLQNDFILTATKDNKNNLFFATRKGISKLPWNSYSSGKIIFENFIKDSSFPAEMVASILEDNNGTLWIGTLGNGLFRCDIENNKIITTPIVNYSKQQDIQHTVIHQINKDNEGAIWLATGGGLSRYFWDKNNLDSVSFKNYHKKNGLASDIIYSFINDKNGSFWIGTAGSGLNKYYGNATNVYSPENGIIGRVWSMTETKKGDKWFGTSNTLIKHSNNKFENFMIDHYIAHVRSMYTDSEDNVWLGTYAGVLKINTNNEVTVYTNEQGLPKEVILSICKDKKGNFWFGTYGNGVSKFDGKSFTNYTTENGLCGNVIKTIIEDKDGNIWFGTNGNGISKYDGTDFYTYTKEQGLASNNILSSCIDKNNNIWFGTFGGGVSKFNGKDFTNYTTADGMVNDVVFAVLPDTIHNKIWLGTNIGLCALNMNKHFSETDSTIFETYNIPNGYPIKDVNTGALMMDKAGIIWIGSDDKLIKFNYKNIKRDTIPAFTAITGIKIRGEYTCWNGLKNYNSSTQNLFQGVNKNDSLSTINEEFVTFKHLLNNKQRKEILQKHSNIKFDSITPFYPLPINLMLPYAQNDITFEFVGIETSRPQLIKYQYMLEGHDKNWRQITSESSANFGNIYEGTYTFKLKALSPDGIWSQPITYTFKVLPPWYRTWWMYLIYITSIISSAIIIYRWRTASLRKDKEILEKTVHERTAELVEQKEIVEEKQKEILDSINYAKRIQYTLLAHDELLENNLKNYFVLFNPKDIVSGDFYWATESKNNLTENPLFYIAACDSTGHGVPGAFMSLLNISFLNEAINEKNIAKPNEIFDYVRKRLIESVSKDGAQDGMDGILACFEKTTNNTTTCFYAAANNPPVLIRKNAIVDLLADKMPVGKGERLNPFTLYTIDCEPGDVLYFYTDGYADQFGGPKGKKFKYKQLDELLINIHQKNMGEQKNILQKTLNEWRGELEQVDDVLIIGIKITN